MPFKPLDASLAPLLRPMQYLDVLQVAAIEQTVSDDPWTESIFRDCILVGYEAWVFEVQGEIVGYALLSMEADDAHILNIAIKDTWRKQGLGKKLMWHLIDLARKKQAKKVLLEVRQSNDPAISLYKKLNFINTGMRKDYYKTHDGREDAILFSLTL